MRMTATGAGGGTAGGPVMSTSNQIGLFTSYFTNGAVVTVMDCNGNKLGTVVETWQQTWSNSFTFSTQYTIQDASGRTIATTDGTRFFANQITVYDASNGQAVGQISWSWQFGGALVGQSVTISQWTGSGPARAEFLITLAQIGFLRYITGKSSGGNADQCSRFVIAGVPVLIIIQLVVMCACFGALTNKVLALALSLLLYPFLALAFAAFALGVALTLAYAPVYFLLRCCGVLDGNAPFAAPFMIAVAAIAGCLQCTMQTGGGTTQRAASFQRATAASMRWGQRARSGRRDDFDSFGAGEGFGSDGSGNNSNRKQPSATAALDDGADFANLSSTISSIPASDFNRLPGGRS